MISDSILMGFVLLWLSCRASREAMIVLSIVLTKACSRWTRTDILLWLSLRVYREAMIVLSKVLIRNLFSPDSYRDRTDKLQWLSLRVYREAMFILSIELIRTCSLPIAIGRELTSFVVCSNWQVTEIVTSSLSRSNDCVEQSANKDLFSTPLELTWFLVCSNWQGFWFARTDKLFVFMIRFIITNRQFFYSLPIFGN